MSVQPFPTPAQTSESATTAPADAAYYRQALHELIDMGMAIARTLNAEAQAAAQPGAAGTPAPDGAAPDLTTRFDRIARCVRRTVRLAQHIAQHIAQPPRPAAPSRAHARAAILRACENNIARAAFHSRTPIDAPASHTELLERLDSLDLDADIDTRTLPDIIKEICKDLGLGLDDLPGTCPAPRRTPSDIALLHARAAQPPGTMARTVARITRHPGPPVHDG